ncbi:MAG: Mth938-like domain-containing protein [Sneathiella sp.]|nr:Mth938-like domain-containing protein [Sneathiella sp.]
MQDISGRPKEGQQLINGYGEGGFRVSGIRHEGSVLILPEKTLAWPLSSIDELSLESLSDLTETDDHSIEILLIGCGGGMAFIEDDIRLPLRKRGIVIDTMNTGAAVRTYNVLLLEGRRVAAALIAV